MKRERNVRYVRGIGSFILKIRFYLRKFFLFSFCLGCSFESNNQEFSYTSGNIAIEWESSAYYLRYLSNREQVNSFIKFDLI
jgi:hypothetical protein